VVPEVDFEPLDGAAALIVAEVGITAESPACGLCGAGVVVGGVFEAGWGLVLDSFAAPVLEDLDAGVAAFGFVEVGDTGAWKVLLRSGEKEEKGGKRTAHAHVDADEEVSVISHLCGSVSVASGVCR
jgi:hypothetical protein